MRNPWDPIVEMQAMSHAHRREMLRDLELMSRRQLLRRGGTLVAGVSAASILFRAGIPLHASAQEATPGYLAGPVEATAIGNVLVQARAAGVVGPTLADLRALVARTHDLARFAPHP